MKLRNKKTGGIVELDIATVCTSSGMLRNRAKHYNSIAELNEEWEDVPEEPEIGFIIDPMEEDYISADDSGYEDSDVERAKELGIWFETEEEAEQAVKKLKAYKRLKDKGFRFESWEWKIQKINYELDFRVLSEEGEKEADQDLDLLFGGEE